MAHRVIPWGTGNVGAFALRCIIEHPDLDLAGVCVHIDAILSSVSHKFANVLLGIRSPCIRSP